MPDTSMVDVVNSFIRDDASDLLVLRGRWGVGKTCFWKNLAAEASKRGEIAYGYYSYVSLFGINSLEELRNAIIAARVASSRIGRDNPLFEGIKKFAKEIEKSPKLREWTGGLASYYFFPLVKGTLVCLDGLERKGESLDFKDLFGLVLILKEQLDCKVVIIANEGTLADGDRESFRRHGEKLIDVEVEFVQSPEGAFSCAFRKSLFGYGNTREACLKLKIVNIRILQRISRFLRKLEPVLKACEPPVVEQVIKALVLFVWCFYDRDGTGPTFEYLKKLDIGRFVRARHERLNNEERRPWESLLREYGYTYTDELDLLIADYIEKGFLNKDSLMKKLAEMNAAEKASAGRKYYRQAWSLYSNTFDDNEGEFVDALVAGFREKLPFLMLNDLRDVVAVLRRLQRDQLADSLVDEFFVENREFLKTVEGVESFVRASDSYISAKIAELSDESPSREQLGEVVRRITSSNGWNNKDEEILADSSVEEYCDFFSSEHSENLVSYVRRCLQFGEYVGATDRQKLIAGKVRQALQGLAFRSRINRLRISEIYGLDSTSEQPSELSENQ